TFQDVGSRGAPSQRDRFPLHPTATADDDCCHARRRRAAVDQLECLDPARSQSLIQGTESAVWPAADSASPHSARCQPETIPSWRTYDLVVLSAWRPVRPLELGDHWACLGAASS